MTLCLPLSLKALSTTFFLLCFSEHSVCLFLLNAIERSSSGHLVTPIHSLFSAAWRAFDSTMWNTMIDTVACTISTALYNGKGNASRKRVAVERPVRGNIISRRYRN